MSGHTDRTGNPVRKRTMFRMVSENMLANAIAFEEAGVPLEELTQAIGRDGGTIVGRGVVFTVPMKERLTEEDAAQLAERYSELVGDYSKSRLGRGTIDNVKLRHDVSSKAKSLRSYLRERGETGD